MEVLLSSISLDQLHDSIQQIIRSELKREREKSVYNKIYLSRREVSDLLKVSLVTIHNWTNQGILKKYKISGQVRYRMDEVLSALQEIETKKH